VHTHIASNLHITSLFHTKTAQCMQQHTLNLFRKLWTFAALQPCLLKANMLIFSFSLIKCLLSQTSWRASYKLNNFAISSSADTLHGHHVYSRSQATRSYPGFSGLVESTADRKHGATLHGQNKCSQADSQLGYRNLRKSTLQGGYTWDSASWE
jgi:hypothetical protein